MDVELRQGRVLTLLGLLLGLWGTALWTHGYVNWTAIDVPFAALLVMTLLTAIWLGARRLSPRRGIAHWSEQLAIGTTWMLSTFGLIAVFGRESLPLAYLAGALVVTLLPWQVALGVLSVAAGADLLLQWRAEAGIGVMVSHTVLLAVFAFAYHLLLAARMRLADKSERDAVQRRIYEAEERARLLRFSQAGTERPDLSVQADEAWTLAAVREVESAMAGMLELCQSATKSDAAAVYLLGLDGSTLRLYEGRAEHDGVFAPQFSSKEGMPGAVLKRKTPIRMHHPEHLKGVSYRQGDQAKSVLIVPLLEPSSGRERGVVAFDRTESLAYNEQDEFLVVGFAAQMLRAIEAERLLGYVRKARDEKTRVLRAMEELNRAGTPDLVYGAVLEAVSELLHTDFAAVTLVRNEGAAHQIVKVQAPGDGGRALEGVIYPANSGLVANVVRYGAALPGRDAGAMDKLVIFDEDMRVRGLQSLRIVPLMAGDQILGTLVAGSRRSRAFGEDGSRTLEILAMQAAQAILRAELFAQMETMATTDGLTGAWNRRSLDEKLEGTFAACRRYQRPMAFLLTDVDHFKSVNDTYGHGIGDQVLKGVAQVLKKSARDTDIVARYGGEEFAVLMPETDLKGAMVIAERIRQSLASHVFSTEQGPLKVTVSIGVAALPGPTETPHALMAVADECLYTAKRLGRNRVICVETPKARASAPR